MLITYKFMIGKRCIMARLLWFTCECSLQNVVCANVTSVWRQYDVSMQVLANHMLRESSYTCTYD